MEEPVKESGMQSLGWNTLGGASGPRRGFAADCFSPAEDRVRWRRNRGAATADGMRVLAAGSFALVAVAAPALAQRPPLTAEQEARADAIHARVLTLDT